MYIKGFIMEVIDFTVGAFAHWHIPLGKEEANEGKARVSAHSLVLTRTNG